MIYLDHAASSPINEKSLSTLNDCLLRFANPSSNHALGRALMREIDEARIKVLKSFRLSSNDYRVIFTSSATESNNLTIKGIAKHYSNRGRRLIVSSLEHPSVSKPFEALRKEGYDVVYLKSKGDGTVDLNDLQEKIDGNTTLVSVIGTNNELGSINDIEAISKIVHRFPKAYLHVDATQTIGKTDLKYGNIDLFSFSAHKFGGPKGIGGLVCKKSIAFEPQLDGGEQEYGYRSSTLNYPSIMAMSVALNEAMAKQKKNLSKVTSLNEKLRLELSKNPEISINSPLNASPYILNFSLKSKKASVVVEALSQEGIYVSSVSACSSKGEPISNILLAIGKEEGDARNSIRVSFGADSTIEEVDGFVEALNSILERTIRR